MLIKSNDLLIRNLAQQSVVWFKAANAYVLVAPQTAKLIERIGKGLDDKALIDWSQKNLKLSKHQSEALLKATFKLIAELNVTKPVIKSALQIADKHQDYAFIKYYKIGNFVVKASFESEALAFLIHPKFDHLSVSETLFNTEFEVFIQDEQLILKVDNLVVGTWAKNEVEYFQGKFSMCLITQLYGKAESEWMGVFHASALSDGKNSVLFMGDSGNGKSTLAALLMAKGFGLLADDFVPVLAATQQVYYFPAAVSIKESAVKALTAFYPKLDETPQYHFVNLNKKVHYLAPPAKQKDFLKQQTCKAFVFVKYQKNSPLSFEKIASEDAFQQLIPDAWLSPEPKNAEPFLNWFAQMPCYQLNYSNNSLMCQTIKKLFKDDL